MEGSDDCGYDTGSESDSCDDDDDDESNVLMSLNRCYSCYCVVADVCDDDRLYHAFHEMWCGPFC